MRLPAFSLAAAVLAPAILLFAAPAKAALYVTIVQGLGGLPEYDEKFTAQRERITTASQSLAGEDKVTVFHGEQASRDNLLAHFDTMAGGMTGQDRAIIYLIGHGSYDGLSYKFNIPGPDITTADLKDVLDSLPGDNHFLVDTSSTSGAILEELENSSRIIVTATRSGNERNATEFGAFFAEALSSEEADVNKDNVISIQEAFDYTQRRISDFFESAGKLATEHAQLRGEGAGRFTLARLEADRFEAASPEVAGLLDRRQAIDAEIETLQLNRDDYSDAEYLRLLRDLILESAAVTEQIDQLTGEGGDEVP